MSLIILGLVTSLGVLYLSAMNWRRSLYAVFILIIIEGILRKWFLPQLSDLLYFLKDLVLLGAYLKFFVFSKQFPKHKTSSYPLKFFLSLSVFWCFFQAFNPSLGSSILGLFGLRGYLFYIPLLWLIPHLFETKDDLKKALRFYLLLAIPVCVLGILQFFSPATSPLNVYAGGEDPTAGFSGTDTVRITGTFSYINLYAAYLSFSFAILLPLILTPQSKIWQAASLAVMSLVVANSLMTGSRGVIVFQALYIVGFFVLTGLKHPSQLQVYIRRFTLPGLATAFVLTHWLRPAFDTFASRATSADNLTDRIFNSFDFIPYFQFKGLDGYGTGATHPAISALRNALELPNGDVIPTGFESEMGRIALELGILGFIFWYGLRLVIIYELFKLFWRLRDPFLQQLALAAFLTHFLFLSGQLVVHHVFVIYYWSLAGFIILLPYLDKGEAWRVSQPAYYVPNSYDNLS